MSTDTDTVIDPRTFLDRAAPVLAVDHPYQHTTIVAGTARAYAAAAATAAEKRYAAFTALAAGELIRKAFGDTAERALFDRDDDGDMKLVAVYDADARLLWFDNDSDLWGSLAVRDRDEAEAYGGPVLPRLDWDTKKAIEQLVDEAEQAPDGWLNSTSLVTGKTEQDGQAVESYFDGDLHELKISEGQRDAEWHRPAGGLPTEAMPLAELLGRLRGHLAAYRSTDDAETANHSAEQVANTAEALLAALQIRAYEPTEDTDDRLEQVVVSLYGVDLSIRGRTEDLFVHVDSSDRDEDDAIRYPLVVGVNNASEDIYHS